MTEPNRIYVGAAATKRLVIGCDAGDARGFMRRCVRLFALLVVTASAAPVRADASPTRQPPAPAKARAKGTPQPAPSSTTRPPSTKTSPSTGQTLTWDRAAWGIETGLRPIEIDRLRRLRCIPGKLTPATETRLRRALDRWDLTPAAKTARIASWTCGAPSARSSASKAQSTRKPVSKAGAKGAAKPTAKATGKATAKSPAKATASSTVKSGTGAVGRSVPASRPAMPSPAPATRPATGSLSLNSRSSSSSTVLVAEIQREQVERDLMVTFPPLPTIPLSPLRPSLREFRTDAWWSLAAGGTASIISATFCRRRATAPQPYGGTYGGKYHVAGSFVASSFLVCTSSMLLSTAVLTLPVLRTQARVKYRADVHRFDEDTLKVTSTQRAYNEAVRARAAMVDSAWKARRAASDSARAAAAGPSSRTPPPSL